MQVRVMIICIVDHSLVINTFVQINKKLNILIQIIRMYSLERLNQ